MTSVSEQALSVLSLAIIGGAVSFIATATGSLGGLFLKRIEAASKFRWSMDFALGLMLSASAFSLIGPELIKSIDRPQQFMTILSALAIGAFFVYSLKFMLDRQQKNQEMSQDHRSKILLALTLIVHNFPEGMGAGASLGGLDFHHAFPVQTAIAMQNIAEGFLMVMVLKSIGFSLRNSVIGGLLSGVVEFLGAIVAGLAIDFSMSLLPLFLAAAGGAMIASVIAELKEAVQQQRTISAQQLAMGLLTIPLMNMILGS